MESKSFYFPQNEHRSINKGWAAIINLKNDFGVNRGCTGFKNKYSAEKWLSEEVKRISNGESWKGYTIEKAYIELI